MPYLGNPPAERFTSFDYQDLTGGSGTSFTLDNAVGNPQEIEVFVNNVRQEPGVAYTVSGTALTMTGSIATTDDFYVVFQGKAIQTATHPSDRALTATDGTFTGDATVTGDLTVDTSVLKVDASGNKVGIGTASPDTIADIAGSGVPLEIDSTNSNTYKVQFKNNGTVTSYLGTTSNAFYFANSSAAQLARLDSDGLKFGTDSAAANALDDYEEGTWTPVLGGTGADPTVSYDIQLGWYQKIGNLVYFGGRLQWNSSGSSGGSGDGTIKILPFTAGGPGSVGTGCGFVKLSITQFNGTFSSGRDYLDLVIETLEARMRIYQLDYDDPSGSTYTQIGVSQCIGGDARLDFSGHYTVS